VPVRPSVLRPALLAAAILALLALVALASRSDRHAGPANPETRTLPAAFWDYFLTFGLLAAFAILALVVYLKVPVRPNVKRGRFSFIQLLALTSIAVLVALAGTRPEWPDIKLPSGAEETSSDRRAETTTQENSAQDSRSLRIRWEVFFATGGLLVVGVGIFAARRRRNALRTLAALEDAATALSAALDESVDDLRAERDPRRAVIAAYARMERTLEGHGFPRFRAEAPLEYLARVLRELRVRSAAVLALTELFERAKFSQHEIDADMKDEAIGALIAVRDDVRAGGTA
jgi:hypothetical protein